MNSGNAMFGAISEKFCTSDMQINFAIPLISHFLLRNYWAFHDSP